MAVPPSQERVTSTVFAGVIVFFTADETLLTVIGWVLACLCGVGLIALPQATGAWRFLMAAISSPSSLPREMTDERLWPGGILPVRCPVRSASVSDRSEPLDRFRRQPGFGLAGWQSDGR